VRPEPDPTRPAGDDAVGWAGVALFTVCAILVALVELFLVPLRDGVVLVPIAVVLAIVGNVVLPRMSYSLVRRTSGAVAPVLGWLLVVLVVALLPRPEGDVVLPGGGYVQWVSYGVLLGGAIAGTVTIVMVGTPVRAGRP
jgi:hypothetical protein